LLNSGGTALTGAATITVSGISGLDSLLVLVDGASSASAGSFISLRFNSDSGTNYASFGGYLLGAASYGPGFFEEFNGFTNTKADCGTMSGNAGSTVSSSTRIEGANTAGLKVLTTLGAAAAATGNDKIGRFYSGFWNNVSTISSVSAISSTGNFDAGRIYVYGAA
jgi:hypothetical protein